jgi:Arc/MetJ-type ribon-helix-helix transcriptional regulator
VPRIEVTLPDQIDDEIARFIEQGEFVNRDEAVEQLLNAGLNAYDVHDDEEPGEVGGYGMADDPLGSTEDDDPAF